MHEKLIPIWLMASIVALVAFAATAEGTSNAIILPAVALLILLPLLGYSVGRETARRENISDTPERRVR